MLRFILAGSLAMTALGCSTLPVEPIYLEGGNLDLYRSLADLGAMMRVEDGCNGLTSGAVSDRWLDHYYPRQSAIRTHLEREHGAAALDEADEINAHPGCGAGTQTHHWRARYEAVLNTLEQRLSLATPR